MLLGRPWQFDRKVSHDGYTNKYSLTHQGKRYVLAPKTPQELYVYEQMVREKREKEMREKEMRAKEMRAKEVREEKEEENRKEKE